MDTFAVAFFLLCQLAMNIIKSDNFNITAVIKYGSLICFKKEINVFMIYDCSYMHMNTTTFPFFTVCYTDLRLLRCGIYRFTFPNKKQKSKPIFS